MAEHGESHGSHQKPFLSTQTEQEMKKLQKVEEGPIVNAHARELAIQRQRDPSRQDKGKHLKAGRDLAAASRRRTPGQAAGSEQDRLQRKIAGREAARELIRATKKKNTKKKGEKKSFHNL